MDVPRGAIVSLLGRNGSGRSTLLRSVMGLTRRDGSIRLGRHELAGLEPFRIARLGVGYVPEGREVFARLTVEQNLLLGRKPSAVEDATGTTDTTMPQGSQGQADSRLERPAAKPQWTLDDMYRMFPALHARRRAQAGVLSGGEQQMLTLCRTLMGNPRLMLVDEPTEGLAPAMAQQVADFLIELRDGGVSVLLVEQKSSIAMAVSERCYLMGRGRIVFEGTPQELAAADDVRREWLEV